VEFRSDPFRPGLVKKHAALQSERTDETKSSARQRLISQPWLPALALALLWTGCARPQEKWSRNTTRPVFKSEIKLYVTAASAAQALDALKLDEHQAGQEVVCFFDTGDGNLESHNLILRARQEAGQRGEFAVKLRGSPGSTELSDAERAIPAEQDWTNEDGPAVSRTVERKSLPKDLVSKVVAGQAPVDVLFNDAQRQLVTSRIKDFSWESLRRYGPVQAKVWQEQWQLKGFPESVTVELWHLRQGARTEDILEVSAKAKAATEEEAKALVRQFFAAAKAAGLGEPSGQTKTRKVLEFFKPGK
jgi:hypothetical protein